MIYLITKQKELFKTTEYKHCDIEYSLKCLNKLESISFDTETNGLEPYKHKLICIQLGNNENQFIIDCNTIDILEYKELLETKELIIHNAKFDLGFLYQYKIVPTKLFDTFLAEKILTTGLSRARRGLNYCALKYCDVNLDKSIRLEIAKEGLTTRVIQYSADDVKYLEIIKDKQIEKAKEEGLLQAIFLDNHYVKVLTYIEHSGMYLNKDMWQTKCDEDKTSMLKMRGVLNDFILNDSKTYYRYINPQLSLFEEGVQCNINWNSEKQVIPLMKELGIDTKIKDKKTGKYKDSIDKKVLISQKKTHHIVEDYLKYKEYQKEVSTYGENFFDYIEPKTGRIHTNYTQIMNTGRLSSGQKGSQKKNINQKPNMQNIPSEDRTRNCFQAQKDNTLIVSDYSGQENVVLVNKCLDKDLLAFYRGQHSDMHSFVASKIFPELKDLPLSDIKKKHKNLRQIAKGAGFSINYGGAGITIAQNLNLPLEKGEEVYKSYFNAFPGLAKYFTNEKKKAVENGYILFNNISGRKCYIDYYDEFKELAKKINVKGFWTKYKLEKSQNSSIFVNVLKPLVREYFMKRGNIERMSLNYTIQGTSADITKLAGIYMFRYLKDNDLLFKVLMPNVVHDELIIECSTDKAESLAKILQNCMERAGDKFCKTIPLKAEPCITKIWAH